MQDVQCRLTECGILSAVLSHWVQACLLDTNVQAHGSSTSCFGTDVLVSRMEKKRAIHCYIERQVLGVNWFRSFLVPRLKCKLCQTTSTLTSDDDMKQLATALFDGAVRFDEGHHIVKLRPSSMSVGVYAGESNALQGFLLSQSNIDAYKRINTAAGWKKAAGRTLCSAVDFSQTEHLRRFAHFGSWVVHGPASQAEQRVKLRKAVQRTSTGQNTKMSPLICHFLWSMLPSRLRCSLRHQHSRMHACSNMIRQQSRCSQSPAMVAVRSLAALASVHRSTASASKLRMCCPTGSTLGA